MAKTYFRAPDAFIEEFDAVTATLQPQANRSHWIRQAMVDFMLKHKRPQLVTTTPNVSLKQLFATASNGNAMDLIACVLSALILPGALVLAELLRGWL